jgi:hypothetical protein
MPTITSSGWKKDWLPAYDAYLTCEEFQLALLGKIDEYALVALYSATSHPFDLSGTGKIAVKDINHYGDEVLRCMRYKKRKNYVRN